MLIKLGLTLIRIQRERLMEREEGAEGEKKRREEQKGRETSERIRTGKVTPAASLIAVSFNP